MLLLLLYNILSFTHLLVFCYYWTCSSYKYGNYSFQYIAFSFLGLMAVWVFEWLTLVWLETSMRQTTTDRVNKAECLSSGWLQRVSMTESVTKKRTWWANSIKSGRTSMQNINLSLNSAIYAIFLIYINYVGFVFDLFTVVLWCDLLGDI